MQLAAVFRAAFGHYYRVHGICVGGAKEIPKVFFRRMPLSPSLDIFGLDRQVGLARRPLWNKQARLADHIAATMMMARNSDERLHVKMPLVRFYQLIWSTDAEMQLLAVTRDLLRDEAMRIKDNLDTDGRKRRALTPKETTTTASQFSRKRPRDGPCIFGHENTSGRDNRRRPRWNAVPRPSPWLDIEVGSTLCQACYEHMLRSRASGVYTRPNGRPPE